MLLPNLIGSTLLHHRAGLFHLAGLLDLLFVGLVFGHLELALTLDDDAAVLVVFAERLYSVALPVGSDVGCIDAMFADELVHHTLCTLL